MRRFTDAMTDYRRCISQGDVLCNEDTGSVYIFKRWDTMGRMVVWDSHGGIKVVDPIPTQLWRYEREELVSNLPSGKSA